MVTRREAEQQIEENLNKEPLEEVRDDLEKEHDHVSRQNVMLAGEDYLLTLEYRDGDQMERNIAVLGVIQSGEELGQPDENLHLDYLRGIYGEVKDYSEHSDEIFGEQEEIPENVPVRPYESSRI